MTYGQSQRAVGSSVRCGDGWCGVWWWEKGRQLYLNINKNINKIAKTDKGGHYIMKKVN